MAEAAEADTAKSLTGKPAMHAYLKRCWDDANAAVASIGDAQLAATVSTPWDMSFPGWVGFNILSDEFLHHRGQLVAYARICGVQPPFIWGFQDNAPEYRPAQ